MRLMKTQDTWDPFREMEAMWPRMNRLFGMTKWPGNGEGEFLAMTDWSPPCDIMETPAEYRIQAELPKVRKEDVHVRLEDGLLTIQGERCKEEEQKGSRFHRRELAYGHFMRQFTMPDDADEGKVDATFKDGMLNVVICRGKTPSPKVKEIAVH